MNRNEFLTAKGAKPVALVVNGERVEGSYLSYDRIKALECVDIVVMYH